MSENNNDELESKEINELNNTITNLNNNINNLNNNMNNNNNNENIKKGNKKVKILSVLCFILFLVGLIIGPMILKAASKNVSNGSFMYKILKAAGYNLDDNKEITKEVTKETNKFHFSTESNGYYYYYVIDENGDYIYYYSDNDMYDMHWYATDSDGRYVGIPYEIYEYDYEAPNLYLYDLEEMELEVGKEYLEPGFSAYDATDGNLTDRVEVSGNVDSSKAGEYILVYKVKDNNGNSTTKVRKIKYVDNNTNNENNNNENNNNGEENNNIAIDKEALILEEVTNESKRILAAAERNYILKSNKDPNYTVNEFKCVDLVEINTNDYANCKVNYNNRVFEIKLEITTNSIYNGIVCEGTSKNVSCKRNNTNNNVDIDDDKVVLWSINAFSELIAEKANLDYIVNRALNINYNEKSIPCSRVLDINNSLFESCSINYDNHGDATVKLKGASNSIYKNKMCEGTSMSMSCGNA